MSNIWSRGSSPGLPRRLRLRTGTGACPCVFNSINRVPQGRIGVSARYSSPVFCSWKFLKPLLINHRHSGESRNPFLRLLPFVRVPAHRRGMKRRRSFTRIRKWIPAFAGMTNENQIRRGIREENAAYRRDRPPCLSLRNDNYGGQDNHGGLSLRNTKPSLHQSRLTPWFPSFAFGAMPSSRLFRITPERRYHASRPGSPREPRSMRRDAKSGSLFR